jgi:hypothetical protein
MGAKGGIMGLFRRAVKEETNYDDPAVGDGSWLAEGESRYKSLISNHYGSPDTIAAGGDQRRSVGDLASALFFYQKAIDTLHSIYVCGFNDTGPASWRRQPSERDLGIADRYLETLREVREIRPGAPVGSSVTEVTHRLRTISTQFKHYGLGEGQYIARLEELARIAPDVDVSGVFWS